MSGSNPNDSDRNDSTKRKRNESNSESTIPSWITTSSPPRFVSLEELMNTAVGLDNMAIAHEIAINSDFKLEKMEHPSQSLPKVVHDMMHQAFWDTLRESLNESPRNYHHALILLQEIKQNLLSLLLPHHTKLKSEIDEHLDLDLIKQQCDNNTVEFMPIAQYIINVMSKLCAPIRDEAVQKLKECEDIVLLFKGSFEVLDLMKLDMANFAIASMRPTIQQHSVEYERGKFADYLKLNPGGLEYTTNWFRRAVEILRLEEETSETLSKLPTTSASAQHSIDRNKIFTEAFWMLLEWDNNMAFPETLVVDEARLIDMRNKCLHLIVTASVVIVTANLGGRDLADLNSFKNTLKDKCLAIMEDCDSTNLPERITNVAEQVCVEVDEALDTLNLPKWDQLKRDALKCQIKDLEHQRNAVRKIIRDRVKMFVSSVIGTATASPIKVPPGLNIVQKELARLTGSFLRVVSHNRSVFVEYYDRIVNDLLAQNETQPSVTNKESDSNQET